MIHPKKWRETPDPFSIPFQDFKILDILGYPHAGNYVFQVKGCWKGENTEAYVKMAKKPKITFGEKLKLFKN